VKEEVPNKFGGKEARGQPKVCVIALASSAGMFMGTKSRFMKVYMEASDIGEFV
jgi:hypothetical protein